MITDEVVRRRFFLPVLALALLLATSCRNRSKEAELAVMKWLKCEECVENELEAVRDFQNDAVEPLTVALRGPPTASTENVRRQLGQAYVRVRDRGPAPTLDSTRYVNHYLRNYRALYQSRAIAGLAAIGTSEAMASLEAAQDSAHVAAYQFRSDVRDELERALEGRWASISAGLSRTCGIRIDGKSYCWGNNDQGQLGDGSTTTRPKPTLVANPSGAGENFRFISISVGDSGRHTCGISADKLAFCWGDNQRGQLGDSSIVNRETPTAVHPDAHGQVTFVGVTSGGNHTCAWTPDYRALCWGANQAGQLGIGDSTDQVIPTPVASDLGPVKINAGAFHTCADSLNNDLYCWGSNAQGQLGDGTTTDRTVPVQVAFHGTSIKMVSAGTAHTCVLARGDFGLTEGTAYCMGKNADGQLGQGGTDDRRIPTEVTGPPFLAVSAGDNHTCGITARTRTMLCWGDNQYGQLGDGTTTDRLVPTTVSDTLAFLGVSAGAGHTCAITVKGEAYCWGRNSYGQLGDNTTTDHLIPVKVVKP